MIPLVYAALVALTAWLLWRHFQGRTVLALVRRPPPGSDLLTVVSALSYLDHELIKHRLPVLQSLLGKRVWNDEDFGLLGRTLGRGEASLLAEFQRYLAGIQRGAGSTLINFRRDAAFFRALGAFATVQSTGEAWLEEHRAGGPEENNREGVRQATAWLVGPFKRYLHELQHAINRSPITTELLSQSAARGLAEVVRTASEAGARRDSAPMGRPSSYAMKVSSRGEVTGRIPRNPPAVVEGTLAASLTVEGPNEPVDGVITESDLDVVVRNLVRNAAQLEHPDGESLRIHVDVRVLLDETGDESVLVRVHDNYPRMLSREDIYGRDARRGLGLVTTALNRHQGAVRCVPPDVAGYAKAMEVRLQRALHQPDREALSWGRPRRLTWLLPPVLLVFHGLFITLLLWPYLADPIADLSSVTVSVRDAHCQASTHDSAGTVIVMCDYTAPGADGWPSAALSFPRLSGHANWSVQSSDACLDVRGGQPGGPESLMLRFQPADCAWTTEANGVCAPLEAELRLSSPWRYEEVWVVAHLMRNGPCP